MYGLGWDRRLQILKSTFQSQNVRLACTLRRPAGVERPPVVLMVHGWGGVQDSFTPAFCTRFAELGWATMVFDYPGWGESEGTPRQVISPRGRAIDVDNALRYLQTRPEIDAQRIVMWGSSMGAGHVFEVAARHPELLGAIGQVPLIDGRAATLATPIGKLLKFGTYGLIDLLRGDNPLYVPTLAREGKFGSMDRDSAWEAMQKGVEMSGKPYDNRVAARSLLHMGSYRPFKALAQIRVPTLIIGGTRDTVAPFVEKRIRDARNPMLEVVKLDAHHFDPYLGNVFEQNIALQLEFLKRFSSVVTAPAACA